jgi:hypothetical protein
MLSGTLDVSTPAQNARNELLPVMENAHQVVLAEFAHTGDLYFLQREATRHLLTTFFVTGEVDDSLYEPNTVNFEPNWGLPLIAKLVVGGGALALIVAALVIFFVVRWVRRVVKRRHAAAIAT